MVQVRLTSLVFLAALVVLVLSTPLPDASTTILSDIEEITDHNTDIYNAVNAFNRDPTVSSAMVSASKCREMRHHDID
jgi:hypothetical protein